ncbi:MAG TPA: choice-of-anchor tandem repeat GloVer-containing protein, partial [Thermoanaerobaculia bacterium]|nr:choice-of-anchor tandem repeat GloVer-containing protein [Thermoanaerobaculia bacterium]
MPANPPVAAAVPLSGRSPASRGVFAHAAVLAVAVCLFATAAKAQTYNVLVFFNSAGLSPEARLIQGTDGNLYGTIPYSRANGYGTIFKIDINGTTLTTLHSFAYSDGAYPWGGLIQGSDGKLYGTTLQGGASGKGTIFKIDTNGSTLTTLHSFDGSDGAAPNAGVFQGADGNLYGT